MNIPKTAFLLIQLNSSKDIVPISLLVSNSMMLKFIFLLFFAVVSIYSRSPSKVINCEVLPM